MSNSSLENSLSYYAKKFSGYTSNVFKIMPSGKTSAIQSNDIVTINLPSNSICDLRTFSVFFNAGITTAAGANNNPRLPAKIDSLFSSIEILVGGVQVSQGNSFYNVLRHMKDAVCGDKTDPVCGHPDIVRAVSTSGVGAFADDNPEVFLGTNTATGSQFISPTESPYCVSDWEGFLGTCEPRLLDLSLMGSVQIRITFAPNSVLTNSLGSEIAATSLFADNRAVSTFVGVAAGSAEYEVKNLFATIECISIHDENYDAVLADMMSTQGYLSVPFKNYYAFSQSHSGTSKFQISSQSIDRIWTAYRPSSNVVGTATIPTLRSHSTLSAPLPVPGYVTNPMATRNGTGKEKYVGPSFVFSNLGPSTTYQLQINNSFIPQAPLTGAEVAAYTSKQLPPGSEFPKDLSMAEYLLTSNVACTRLNMVGSELSRTLSGLDSRSSNVMCSLNSSGTSYAGSTFDSIIIVECSSELRLSAGRACTIIN